MMNQALRIVFDDGTDDISVEVIVRVLMTVLRMFNIVAIVERYTEWSSSDDEVELKAS